MKKIIKTIFYYSSISCIYLAINYYFNFFIWRYVFVPGPSNSASLYAEWPIYQYVAEIVRQNILGGKNPFSPIVDNLYPFGWNFAAEDMAPINGFYYLFLRPFFSINQSFTLILLIGIFLSNISMFIFLRMLGICKKIAFLIGLVFGFSPFVAIRIGHPTYTTFYLFTLIGIFFLLIIRSKDRIKSILWSVLLGLIFAVVVLTNLYFAVMTVVLSSVLLLSYLFVNKKLIIQILKNRFKYFFLSILAGLIFLAPWLVQIFHIIKYHSLYKVTNINDSIYFSADLLDIITPRGDNQIYGTLVRYFNSFFKLRNSFENFIYPGLIILLSIYFYIFYKKHLTKKASRLVKPLFIASIFIWVLTLGPYLHILGFRTSIPLPYILLDSIPFVQLVRSPARFIVPFIFLGSVTAAFVLNDILNNKIRGKIAKKLFVICLFLIFFIDQTYMAVVPSRSYTFLPTKIYQYLKNHGKKPLFEIPFVIRDGLKSQGDYDSVWLQIVQLLHGQQTFSIYAGRINDSIFDYYKHDALFETFGKILEYPNNNYSVDKFKYSEIDKSIIFFGIENVLLKRDEKYSKLSLAILQRLGFKEVLRDRNYQLLSRNNQEQEFIDINLKEDDSNLYLAQGWGAPETGGRWTIGKVSKVLFRISQVRPMRLRLVVSSLTNEQKADIYLNGNKIKVISINNNDREYSLYLNSNLKKGLNILTFIFAKTLEPAKIYPDNQDKRDLAALFNTLELK